MGVLERESDKLGKVEIEPTLSDGENWAVMSPGMAFMDQLKGRPRRLTDSDERVLFLGVKRGDTKAWTELFESNLGLVVSIARRYLNRGLDFLELIDEGSVGLIQAIDKFDLSKNTRFSTYATKLVGSSMFRAVQELGRTIRHPEYLGKAKEKLDEAKRTKGTRLNLEEAMQVVRLPRDIVYAVLNTLESPYSLDIEVGADHKEPLGNLVEDTSEAVVSDARWKISEPMRQSINALGATERTAVELIHGVGEDGLFYDVGEIADRIKKTENGVRAILARSYKKIGKEHSLDSFKEARRVKSNI